MNFVEEIAGYILVIELIKLQRLSRRIYSVEVELMHVLFIWF